MKAGEKTIYRDYEIRCNIDSDRDLYFTTTSMFATNLDLLKKVIDEQINYLEEDKRRQLKDLQFRKENNEILKNLPIQ